MNIFPLILTIKFICYKRRFRLLTIANFKNEQISMFSSPFICSVARSPLQRLSLECVSPLQRVSLERVSPLCLCQCQCSGEVGNEHVWWNNSYGLISNISITISGFLKQQTHILLSFLFYLADARCCSSRPEGWSSGGGCTHSWEK
jgi:hypothetical protein